MSRKTAPQQPKAPLREQIARILAARKEATRAQIVPLTTEALYESRVTTELNRMRAEGLIECEKKAGKNELWYWLTVPLEQIVVFETPAPGATLPDADADSDGPSATVLSRVIADIRKVSGVGSAAALIDLPEAIRKAMAKDRERVAELQSEVEAMAAALKAAEEREAAQAHAEATNASQTQDPTEAAELLAAAQSQLNQVCELLCPVISTAIDPCDMDAVEAAQAAARNITDLRNARPAAEPEPAAIGYAALCEGYPAAIDRDFETARGFAEQLLDDHQQPVTLCALKPMLYGRIKRETVWSGQ